ncbi:MAG: zinc-ribbon domain-containing protein [Oscillospiraceae bacterium]|nr:zinc-ribbon domain-containing protein [Oscillospiraceae bacterium]
MEENKNEQNSLESTTQESNSTNGMFCPSCGSRISEGSSFCSHCGAKLNSDKDSGMKTISEKKKHSSGIVAWLITLAVVLILLVPICSFLIPLVSVSTSDDSNSSSTSTTTQVTTSVPELTTITRGTTKETTVTTVTETTTTPATTMTTETTTKATTTTTVPTTESSPKITFATSVQNKTVEITFRDIPWGTSYADAKELLSDLDLWKLAGESYKIYSVEDITLGDYKEISFEKNDINIIGNTWNSHIDVAGYTTEDITLFFAYVPVDGVLTKTEEDSALYGARYEFKPENLSEAADDLKEKLSSLYGEPDSTKTDSDIWGNKYTYITWTGKRNTEVVMKICDSSQCSLSFYYDEIYISYVWLKGDELLQTACDTLIQNEKDAESKVYGDGSTGGL